MKLDGMERNGLRLVVPTNTAQLGQWGKSLNICIASYGDSAARGSTLLLGVEKEDGIKYCIEFDALSIRRTKPLENHAAFITSENIIPKLLDANIVEETYPLLIERHAGVTPPDTKPEDEIYYMPSMVQFRGQRNGDPSKEDRADVENMLAQWVKENFEFLSSIKGIFDLNKWKGTAYNAAALINEEMIANAAQHAMEDMGRPHQLIALGITVIGESEVGIVTKKISRTSLPPGRQIATKGEAGIQAETLSPGWHFGYWPFVYKVDKAPLTSIEQGQLGLVMAIDGNQIDSNRILAKSVDCNNFQSALAFLNNGGEKGKQLGMLTAGKYRINTRLFQVSTTPVTSIPANAVGIVTTLDGAPLENGEIAGATVPDHDNFQNIQKFMSAGGRRGVQEQVILAGSWNLNPWFVQVKTVPMTSVPIGHVGVVTSFVGKAHVDVSGETFKHGDLVEQGHKGVWAKTHLSWHASNQYGHHEG
ncbi:unnamed protein product [Sphagnum balticum]